MKKIFLKKRLLFIICTVLISKFSVSQLIITPASTTGITPTQLVQSVLVGNGVTVSNVTFNGQAGPTASNQIGSFVSTGVTNLGFPSGLLLSSGGVTGMLGPNNSGGLTTPITGTSLTNDPQLQSLAPGSNMNDCAVLEFDFIPISDTIKFRFVFGSEEYMEFVNTSYNDVFGFFISGANPNGPAYVNKNIALIPNTTMPITIDNVNANVNAQYYISNPSTGAIQFDGFTVVLTAKIKVVPCTQYHLKLAVADRGDFSLDSGVFLEANSLSTNAVSVNTTYTNMSAIPKAIECCNNAKIEFKIPQAKSDTSWFPLVYSGTAVNGVDYQQVPNLIFIPPGQTTHTMYIYPLCDSINEPLEFIKIKIDDTLSCTNFLDSVYIELLDYIPISVSSVNDTSICQNVAGTVAAQLATYPVNGKQPYIISWQPTADLNNPNIANPLAYTPIDNHTTYYVEVRDSTGCPMDTSSVYVQSYQIPDVSFFTQPFPTAGCAPLDVVFINETSPAGVVNNWQFGDGSSSTDQNPTHNYQQAGSYTIVLNIETANGCKGTADLPNAVQVYPQPVAGFLVSPIIAPKNNAHFTFSNTSTNSNIYFWDFGDGQNSILSDPTHDYFQNQEYTVWLYASNTWGCKDSISTKIRVVEDSLVFPNIITPNGDGVNDYFDITNLNPESYPNNTLIIYNRWGKKIYAKDNYHPAVDKWDGNGLPDGTYYYILQYEGYIRKGEFKGSLTILR